jgi:hypothetical protein
LQEPALLVSASAFEQRRAETSAYSLVEPAQLANVADLPPPGSRVRMRVRLSNYMLPPKWAGQFDYLPRFATDPTREVYYYACADGCSGTAVGAYWIGVTYFGAVAPTIVREGDWVTIAGRVLDPQPKPRWLLLWVHAETVAP